MVFFWLFPERTERLALISSGGLGHEVPPLLRAAALPGVQALLWAAAHPRLLHTARAGAEELKRRGSDKAVYLEQFARAVRPLEPPGAPELQGLPSGSRSSLTGAWVALDRP